MNSDDKNLRLYLVTRIPVELVIQMALKETDDDVIKNIIKILDNRKENYLSLLKAIDWRIRRFALINIAFNEENIEDLINMALVETDPTVAEKIANILQEKVKLSEVVKSYSKLAAAKSIFIQKFVVNNAPIGIILEMSKEPLDYNVAVNIVERCIK